MSYTTWSVAKLQGLLQERGIDHSKLVQKDSLVATALADDRKLINATSFVCDGPSYFDIHNIRIMESIHERLAGRGTPAVVDILKKVNSQYRKDVLMTVLMYLEMHGITHNVKTLVPVLKEPLEHENILRDVENLVSIHGCAESSRLRFDYNPLKAFPTRRIMDTFTGFRKLPSELRQMVWKEAVNPRIVPILPYKGKAKMTAQPPALLAVNSEARDITLKVYYYEKRIAHDGLELKTNFFHLEQDTLFLNNRSSLYKEPTYGFIERFIDDKLVAGVENLAIGHTFQRPVAIKLGTFPSTKRAVYVMSLPTDPIIFEPHSYSFRNIKAGLLPQTIRDVYAHMDPGKKDVCRDTFGGGRKWLKQVQVNVMKKRVKASCLQQFGKGVKWSMVEARPFKRDRFA